jgi:hypothetical protein
MYAIDVPIFRPGSDEMSVVQVVALTITQADVLYVSQQIKRDLMELSDCYPALVSQRRINELDIAVGTLLFNDAVNAIGFAIEDPIADNLVYHELRYRISYNGEGQWTGIGGSTISPVPVPARAKLTPWVQWSQVMLSLPTDKQRQIVQGTGWGIPGSSTFRGRYGDSCFTCRATYGSGPLLAQAEEFRRDR